MSQWVLVTSAKVGESTEYLLEQALIETDTGTQANPLFLAHLYQLLDLNTHPIFALLSRKINLLTVEQPINTSQ